MIWPLLQLLAICVGLGVVAWLDEGDTPRRPFPLADGEVLPAPSAYDPDYIWEQSVPCAVACQGTAFAIDYDGHWLTARHVVLGCGRIEIVTDDGLRTAVGRVVHHPRADVSLLVTPLPAFALSFNPAKLRSGQDGFHFGFPSGSAGQAHSVLLGRARVRDSGPGGRDEPIIAWAEVSRHPPREGSDAGMSGGAVMDSSGWVVGVRIGSAPRRGRVLSAAPESLSELLTGSGLAALAEAPAQLGEPVGPDTYAEIGGRLRAGNSVVQVWCET